MHLAGLTAANAVVCAWLVPCSMVLAGQDSLSVPQLFGIEHFVTIQFIWRSACKPLLGMQVHYMPFLAAAGYDCYAVSLRGQGGSERQQSMKASNLAQHAADLRHILSSLQGPAVLIGHSFGGLVVQR